MAQAPQLDELFEIFWRTYPRRVGKGDARKVWLKLRPDVELVQQMLVTLAWQRETEQWMRDDGQYIPHPSTWLRQERWTDEPIAPMRGTTSRDTRGGFSISEAQHALALLEARDGHTGTGSADDGVDAVGAGDTGEGGARELRAVSGGYRALFDGRRR
jgi:hypothetical protein